MVDEDQKERALAVQVREISINKEKTNFFVINEYAGKATREAILEYINRLYPEFFEDNDDFDQILNAVNERAQVDIDKFIGETCSEFEMPCLDFEINAPDL